MLDEEFFQEAVKVLMRPWPFDYACVKEFTQYWTRMHIGALCDERPELRGPGIVFARIEQQLWIDSVKQYIHSSVRGDRADEVSESKHCLCWFDSRRVERALKNEAPEAT